MGEDLDRDLLVSTHVYMDRAVDRHFEEMVSLFYSSKNFCKQKFHRMSTEQMTFLKVMVRLVSQKPGF